MTQTTQHQPDWQQPMLDPKAAAKAAKAYAKATRPWYKKKRFMGPLALVVVFGFSNAMSGGDDPSGAKVVESNAAASESGKQAGSTAGSTKSSDKAELGSRENPIAIGKTIELEGTRYTVESAKSAPSVGDSFMQENADGVFVIVELTIENTKDESKLFSDSAAQFVASDGTSYGTDSDATVVAMGDSEPLWLAEMHPDLPTTGSLTFDVPPSKLKGGLLEVSDLFGGGEAYIKLGL